MAGIGAGAENELVDAARMALFPFMSALNTHRGDQRTFVASQGHSLALTDDWTDASAESGRWRAARSGYDVERESEVSVSMVLRRSFYLN